MNSFDNLLTESIERSIAVKRRVLTELAQPMRMAADVLVAAYAAGRKAMFFGNGGSAADAQHLAAELESRLAFDRRPLPALALHANTSTLTAASNDYGYEKVFARLVEAHGQAGDVAMAISTSGTSKNIVAAACRARELGLKVIAFTGEHGATLAPFSDVVLAVPSRETPRIQEAHITIGHILCEWLEWSLFRPRAD